MKITLRKKIILSAVLPLMLLGISVIIIAATIVKGAIISKVEESLKGTAVATQAAYDQNTGSYLKAENGAIWKGSYNISQSETLVDTIKKESGMEVTFFYGSDRIMTSATDKDGNRLLGSPAGDKIVKTVLKGSKEYFSDNVSMDGTIYYGYYVPVYQDGTTSEPIGMVFAGQEKQKTFRSVLEIINTIVAIVLILMVACSIAVGISANSITKALNKSIDEVMEVSSGNLNVKQNQKLLRRNDEIGNLSRAIHNLQEELCKIVGDIKESTDTLLQASNTLEETSHYTYNGIGEVNHAMDTITDGANRQAEDVGSASQNVRDMGDLILKTGREADSLESSADSMKDASDKTAVTINGLRGISADVKEAVAQIVEQTAQTNSSAQSIREASLFISQIAEETNLLSLNASIEAARAGEAGRGFAVVASQIQKLAEQSNAASGNIEEMVNTLLKNSERVVGTMAQTQEVIERQNEYIANTEQSVASVMKQIETSIGYIRNIGQQMKALEAARAEIIQRIDAMSEIAQNNVTGTSQTTNALSEMAESFGKIEKSTENLRQTADLLADNIGHFTV